MRRPLETRVEDDRVQVEDADGALVASFPFLADPEDDPLDYLPREEALAIAERFVSSYPAPTITFDVPGAAASLDGWGGVPSLLFRGAAAGVIRDSLDHWTGFSSRDGDFDSSGLAACRRAVQRIDAALEGGDEKRITAALDAAE